jgi:hypothetical protein
LSGLDELEVFSIWAMNLEMCQGRMRAGRLILYIGLAVHCEGIAYYRCANMSKEKYHGPMGQGNWSLGDATRTTSETIRQEEAVNL